MLIKSEATLWFLLKCEDTGEFVQTYGRYMATDHWKCKKQILTQHIIACRGMPTCEECGAVGIPLLVHHLTYESIGRERQDDLQMLCASCHATVHAQSDIDENPLRARQRVMYSRRGHGMAELFMGNQADIGILAEIDDHRLEAAIAQYDVGIQDYESVAAFVRSMHFLRISRWRCGLQNGAVLKVLQPEEGQR